MANSGERPRRVSPAPLSFCREGENDGDRAETASITEPLMVTCCASVSGPMTSTVSGSALAGRIVRAAVTTTSSRLAGAASSAAAVWTPSPSAPERHEAHASHLPSPTPQSANVSDRHLTPTALDSNCAGYR